FTLDAGRFTKFPVENSSSEQLVIAHNLMQIAMKRLQKEFYTILSGNRYFLDPSTRCSGGGSSTKSSVSDLGDDASEEDEDTVGRAAAARVPDAAVADLKAVAKCRIGAGYGKECMKIYTIIRKSIVDETLYYLGVENSSTSQIQKMDWQTLDERVKNWLSAVKIVVTTLFLGERILCSEVFSASDDIRESCFTEITKDGAMSVLGFAECVGKYKKLSIEKMFCFLDLYEAVSELWPKIESIFDFTSIAAVRSQAVMSLLKLGEAIRAMLTEFETAVQKDSSKPPPGGAVHPLTRYVMNYLVFLSDYSGEVSEIVADWPLSTISPLPEAYFSTPHPDDDDSGASAVSERFAWIKNAGSENIYIYAFKTWIDHGFDGSSGMGNAGSSGFGISGNSGFGMDGSSGFGISGKVGSSGFGISGKVGISGLGNI
ncbi:PREDICTED: exocyst complex component EXO70A1-like, partial [Ipomoea nil]|uniref:exocyst complex component EXO70A1-like n=1 Tax=Ipomoea nil TaxID=35883 RepID=UPI0009018C77